jgi:plasmid maintenance system antidote protein VapI
MIEIRTDKLDFACRSAGYVTKAGARSITALAQAMGMDAANVGRVLRRERGVGQDFITGLRRAFPHLDLLTELLEVVEKAEVA